MTSVTIKKGETGPLWRVGVPERNADGVLTGNLVDLSAPGWACRVVVNSAGTPIDRAVTGLTSDNFRFLVQLTPAETADLSEEAHTVAIEVTNSGTTPPFNKESHQTLVVEAEEAT